MERRLCQPLSERISEQVLSVDYSRLPPSHHFPPLRPRFTIDLKLYTPSCHLSILLAPFFVAYIVLYYYNKPLQPL
jgi:hypothetical protein